MTVSDEDDPGTEPGPPPSPRPARLLRSRHRYVGGVAGGIAERLDVDPLIVRLLLVVATLYLPSIIALYFLAWLVVPDAATGRSLLRSVTEPDGWRAVGGVLVLGLGALLVAPELGRDGDGALTGGVVLLGLGVLLVRGHPAVAGTDAGAPPPAPGAPSGGPPAGIAEPDWPLAGPGERSPGGASAAAPFTLAWLRRSDRPSARLGWLGLSALVVLLGLLAAVDQGLEPVKPGIALSLGLLLIGAVLLVSARWGRARLLLPAGLALLPFWLGWALADVPRYSHDGDADYTLEAGEPLPAAYEHGYGTMDVDLRQLSLDSGERRTVRVGLTAGRARLYVPEDVHVSVTGDVGLGYAEIVEDPYDVSPADTGTAVLREVDIRAGDPRLCTAQSIYPDQPEHPDDLESRFDPETGRPRPPTEADAPGTEYRTPFGEPCDPRSEVDDDPPVLEVDVDLGIGTVEVHRVHPRS